MSDRRTSGSPIRAAGGVVWRMRDDEVEVALVHRAHYDDWSLPKGKLDSGETQLAAAIREIGEEVGSRVAVSRRLPTISYTVDDAPKTVSYWTMRHVDGGFTASDEVDEMAWLPVEHARKYCTYAGDQHVIDAFTAQPVPDSVVVLVRHAKAGKRSEWTGRDDERPLDASGRRQARALVAFLRGFGADQVRSANPVRCVQTVGPFANDQELDVVVQRAFGDEAYADDPAAAEAALRALAVPGRASVVCSQGATIPGLVPAVVPGVRSAETKKAAAWVLSFADGVAVAGDLYPPLTR